MRKTGLVIKDKNGKDVEGLGGAAEPKGKQRTRTTKCSRRTANNNIMMTSV